MKIFSSLQQLAALGALSAAASAWAQVDTSQWKCTSCPYPKGTTATVDAGIGDVTDSSQKFGDYTGLNKSGAFLVLGGNASRRGDDGYYADVTAEDLGIDSRRLYGRAGREGLYNLRIGYQEIPRFLTEGATTPFAGSGSSTLTLPAGATQQPIDIGFKYKRFDLGGTWLGGRGWSAYADVRHDERNGTRPTSGSFFSTAAQFAAPVNEKTDQGELGVAFAMGRLQATLAYHFSLFRNDDNGVTWANPFAPVVAGATTGQLALAPDNDFQQLRGTIAYDITPTIRLSADAAVGRMTQDDAFLAPTLNAALTVPPLPSQSLGGRVDTFNGGVKLTATPLQGVRITASYDHDRRDNRTPVRNFPIVTTDMIVGAGTRANTPFSHTIDRFKLIGEYSGRLPWNMRLTGGAEHEGHDRDYQEVANTRDTTYWGKATAQPLEKLGVSLKILHGWRDNSGYGTVSFFYPENPLLRKFNLAKRVRDGAEARADYAFNEKITLGVTADFLNDDYNQSPIGLTHARTANFAAELAVAFDEKTSGRAFLQTQFIRSTQRGGQTFSAVDWAGDVRDHFDVLGVGIKHVASEKLDIGGDLTTSRGRSEVNVDNGSGAPPFPTASTSLDRLSVYGLYKLKDNMSIVGSYAYEHYTSTDWRLEGIGPATVPGLLSLGAQAPRYTLSVVRVALRYKF